MLQGALPLTLLDAVVWRVCSAGWTVLHTLASCATAAAGEDTADAVGHGTSEQQPSGYWGCIKYTIRRLIQVAHALVTREAAAAAAACQPLGAAEQQQLVSGWVLGVVGQAEPTRHHKGQRVMAAAKELAQQMLLQHLQGLP
jgi:hypothetical protein